MNDSETPVREEPATENKVTAAERGLTRRQALGMLGSTGFVLLTGCGGGGSGATTATGMTTTGTTTTTTGTTGTTTTTTEAVTPEGEIGPYFTDDSAATYNRSNILTNLDGTDVQAGIPLTLKISVYDSENGNAAVSGAQVDIWHCSAAGVYSNESGESTVGQNWLRGYQLSDANGLVTFTTIVPGWYQGRATHIHLRVRSKYSEASSMSDGTNTTQVFLPQATLDYIYTNISPYNAKGKDTTTNVGDRVYTQETKGENEITLGGNYTNGYTATFAIHLPITSV